MKFYTRFNPPPSVDSPCGGPSLTEQQYKDDCDINKILQRYAITGAPLPTNLGSYGDVSQAGDFAQNLEMVTKATQAFEAQPSSIRARFGHDPSAFYDFVSNPDNSAELVRLGLMTEKTVEPTTNELLTRIADGVTSKEVAPSVVSGK